MEYDDGCMFCGNVVCSCNHTAKPKRSRKAKAEANKPVTAKAAPLPSRAPLGERKAPPSLARQRIGQSKVNAEDTVAREAEKRARSVPSRATKGIPDEELEPALRAANFLGMLSKADKARFRHLLDRPEPVGKLWEGETDSAKQDSN